MPDTYVKHTAEDFVEAELNLLPRGPAWPRDPDEVLAKLVGGLGQIWGDVAQRADDLLIRETDPRAALEMLADWERVFGLPDPCAPAVQTVEQRRTTLVARMALIGGQSRQFFIDFAATLGFDLTIREFSPFMTGISRCGDSGDRWEIGPPEIRFYWLVTMGGVNLGWFRVSSGQCGVDPLLSISFASIIECVLRRWKPAHTEVIFDYSGSAVTADSTLTIDAVGFTADGRAP